MRPYAVALAVALSTGLLTWLLQPYLEHSRWLLFLAGVVFVSLAHGRAAGAFATIVALATGLYLVVPPVYSFTVSRFDISSAPCCLPWWGCS